MLGHCYISITCYFNSRLPGFFIIWIYIIVILKYQLILLIDVKQHLHIAMGNKSIQLYCSSLKMHQLTFNII